ncbi:hypothetical protein NDU88_006523 [Pleurodeles waltl]|uniref:Uncharacterized protein n=1 Tax=Pleurodeles waltl TaxID=8319 RepID=A0AAV7SPT1_PLEWA|nr:hypothetical protein NDU88_006523 [Pleurodeles waltl]
MARGQNRNGVRSIRLSKRGVGKVKSIVDNDLVEENTLVDEMGTMIAAVVDILNDNAFVVETVVMVAVVDGAVIVDHFLR